MLNSETKALKENKQNVESLVLAYVARQRGDEEFLDMYGWKKALM